MTCVGTIDCTAKIVIGARKKKMNMPYPMNAPYLMKIPYVKAFYNALMTARWARYAMLPLRLIVGFGFVSHGYAKLHKGPEAFAIILHAAGVPAPHLMTWLTIITEIVCGIAILLGSFVTLVSVPMIVLLLVAIVTVHLPYGFSSIKLMAVTNGRAQFGPPGYECDLLYIAGIVALVLSGPSPFSIDAYREDPRPLTN